MGMTCARFLWITGYLGLMAGTAVDARTWTDASGQYTLEAELVTANDVVAVLQRADHELVAFPVEQLSAADQEFLRSREAREITRRSRERRASWTFRDGTKMVGRVVGYTQREMTIQRRRGQIYVNDRRLRNLPESYQALVPAIVAHLEHLSPTDPRAFERWVNRLRGQPWSVTLDGVVLEAENGDEFAVPFFLLADDDARSLQLGWDEWLAARHDQNADALAEQTFLLETLADTLQQDRLVQREIAQMNLQLQAIQAGVTSLWEVTLYPAAGHLGFPHWVVVPGRSSSQAIDNALHLHPGSIVGPVRRVSR